MEDTDAECNVMVKALGSNQDSPCSCTIKQTCSFGPICFSSIRLDILFGKMRQLDGGK